VPAGVVNIAAYWIRCQPLELSGVAHYCLVNTAARRTKVTLMQELVFEVTQEADGGFVAESLGEGVITQADTWDQLRHNVREAVEAYFFDSTPPKHIRLHLVRDEVLATG
jgi:predicted RNase H-like HicB family nuclease